MNLYMCRPFFIVEMHYKLSLMIMMTVMIQASISYLIWGKQHHLLISGCGVTAP